MRGRAIAGAAALLAAVVGCVSERQQLDWQHQLRKLEVERDALQVALDDEKARSAALNQRIAVESRNWELTRAEVAALRNRVESAERLSAEYQRLLEARSRQELTRPEVPAAPLPADMDRALLAFVERHAGRVWYDRGRGALSFANDRLFESGSDRVRGDVQATLGELAGIVALTEADEFELIIVGHTDNTPIVNPQTLQDHPSNWHLSVHRAIAVKDVLVSAGVPEARMGVMGYGPYRPVSDDNARNRRVELFFVRRGEVKPLGPARPIPAQRRQRH